MTFDKQFMSFV